MGRSSETIEKAYSLDTIEEAASAIHSDMNIANKQAINEIDIANRLGFQVFTTSFDNPDVLGMVISSKEEKSIYINKNEPPLRQKFTVAHEIGHIVLHHKFQKKDFQIVDFDKINSFSIKESEANAFAAALLIPKQKAISAWNELDDVDNFAKHFKVSRLTATTRLANLNLI